ncbi:AbrB/MazE/SpoVT family DNA-binding domain-containing protein [Patescibacteria group bacterium]
MSKKIMAKIKKYIRKATRVGKRSMAVVIPAEIVDTLKIREKQKLILYKKGSSIIIKDWKK